MCGRYTLSAPGDVVADLFELSQVPNLSPRFNIAPTQEAAIVRAGESGRRLDFLRWGLVPSWADDPAIGNRMINARAEGVAEKPSFRNAFKRQRCLVPADGFYEWKAEGKVKQPYWIHRKNSSNDQPAPFAIAGLWSSWRPKGDPDAEPLETFSLITTTPNALMQKIHDRMPVILAPEHWNRWLDPTFNDREALQALLVPAPDELLEAFPVSREVNRPSHDAADCTVAIGEAIAA